MPFISIVGNKIYYLERGQGLPIVFLHGAGSSHLIWGSQFNFLSHLGRAIAFDLPAHNKSEGPGRESVVEYADDLSEILDSLAIDRGMLVGHSMGGAIALAYALARPDRVAALGLIATSARLQVLPAFLEGFRTDFDRTVDKIIAYYFGPEADARMIEKSAAQLRASGQAIVLSDFSACDKFDVRDRLAEIRTPTLVICGAADQLTPPKFSEFLADKILGARLALVEKAGHHVMIEKPETVNLTLMSFVSNLDF